ncbi:SHOCT domain-containing protein [Flavobacterium phycosphaerae]|uniref:SHOCT domain-containing protein n=1 Tax=Flavobacterium phycosphaerae TaxID=2697515 RepID=UPI00138AB9B2|nr:SHOCT domain-containing protein [Flavobacterium phycosphaerae]
MKKFLGIVILFIGLLSLIIGMACLIDAESRNKTLDGQEQNELTARYRDDNNDQRSFGAASAVIGLVFFIAGFRMVSAKTKNQIKKEAELEKLKANINKLGDLTATDLQQTKEVSHVINQIEKLGDLKAKGLLTEEEFEQQKKKVLE